MSSREEEVSSKENTVRIVLDEVNNFPNKKMFTIFIMPSVTDGIFKIFFRTFEISV